MGRYLHEYYRRAGFARRGSAVIRGLAVTLYEKRVGVSGRDRGMPADILTSCASGIVKPDAA
jgi:hypothetical protein